MLVGKGKAGHRYKSGGSSGSAAKQQKGPQDATEPFSATYCTCRDKEINQTEVAQIMGKGVGKEVLGFATFQLCDLWGVGYVL